MTALVTALAVVRAAETVVMKVADALVLLGKGLLDGQGLGLKVNLELLEDAAMRGHFFRWLGVRIGLLTRTIPFSETATGIRNEPFVSLDPRPYPANGYADAHRKPSVDG